jgi:delta 1-pyrroline-5-carboxylate dehydrogenase
VFGPVLPVIPYQTTDEAITLINASEYGLTANVFGPPAQAKAIARKLHCGTVLINDIGASNYAMSCAPWGGWKKSGHGVSHGAQTLRELSLRKVVSVNQRFNWPLLDKPLWLFGKPDVSTEDRSRAVLAFASRHLRMFHPKVWLAFWRHRSSTRI